MRLYWRLVHFCCLVDNYDVALSQTLHQRFFEEYKAFGGNNRDILNDRGTGQEN